MSSIDEDVRNTSPPSPGWGSDVRKFRRVAAKVHLMAMKTGALAVARHLELPTGLEIAVGNGRGWQSSIQPEVKVVGAAWPVRR